MKKQSYFLVIAFNTILMVNSNCQNQKTASDSLSFLYTQYFDLSKSDSGMTEAHQKIDKKVDDNYKKTSDDLANTKKEIEKKVGPEFFNEMQRKENEKLEREILGTASFAKSANSGLNAINSQIANTIWLSEITNLNSVTNDDLGFSITSVFKQLTETHLKPKIKEGDFSRVNSFVNKILNNPLTDVAKSVFPVINSVSNFISGISFSNKKISESDLNDFMKDLAKYTTHYEKLNTATKEFQNGIAHIQTRATALQTILNNFVRERAVNIKTCNSLFVKDTSLSIIITQCYNYQSLQNGELRRIKDSSKTYLLVNEELRKLHPSFTLNQVQFIKDEILYLENQYNAAIEHYQNEIITVISASKILVIGDRAMGEEKIQKKVKVLENRFKEVGNTFKDNVNSQDIVSLYQQLTNYK